MSTPYRKPQPYRKPRTYRGLEVVPGVPPPGITPEIRAPWRGAEARAGITVLPWRDPVRRVSANDIAWDATASHSPQVGVPWHFIPQRTSNPRIRWGDFSGKFSADTGLPWMALDAHRTATALPWSEYALRLRVETAAPWSMGARRRLSTSIPWSRQQMQRAETSLLWRSLARRGAFVAIPWGPSGRFGREVRIDWTNPPPGPPTDPATVPKLPVYYMIPTLSVVRLPDRTPLDALSVSLGIDLDSWCWSFEMAASRAALDLVNPADSADPTAVEVSVNGWTWVFLVEGYSDNRKFGSRTYTLRGRSRSALLAQPYAPARTATETEARDAVQLADQELTATGWTLVWDAPDWLVPGGTFSYADMDPIHAIQSVAQSIGATLQTHPADDELTVAPRYPISPWLWGDATPFAILPAEIIPTASGSWEGGRNANGIYVYGTQGFGALVHIEGSSGELGLGMVVDRMITEATPARERGRIEIARSSRIKREEINIPLFPLGAEDLGLVLPGRLLEIQEGAGNTWRGQVMATRISAQKEGSAVSVRQRLSMERHFR